MSARIFSARTTTPRLARASAPISRWEPGPRSPVRLPARLEPASSCPSAPVTPRPASTPYYASHDPDAGTATTLTAETACGVAGGVFHPVAPAEELGRCETLTHPMDRLSWLRERSGPATSPTAIALAWLAFAIPTLSSYGLTSDRRPCLRWDHHLFWLLHPKVPGALDLIHPDPRAFRASTTAFPAQDDPVQYRSFQASSPPSRTGSSTAGSGRLGETDAITSAWSCCRPSISTFSTTLRDLAVRVDLGASAAFGLAFFRACGPRHEQREGSAVRHVLWQRPDGGGARLCAGGRGISCLRLLAGSAWPARSTRPSHS